LEFGLFGLGWPKSQSCVGGALKGSTGAPDGPIATPRAARADCQRLLIKQPWAYRGISWSFLGNHHDRPIPDVCTTVIPDVWWLD